MDFAEDFVGDFAFAAELHDGVAFGFDGDFLDVVVVAAFFAFGVLAGDDVVADGREASLLPGR